MPRKYATLRAVCAEDGCRETYACDYEFRRDYIKGYRDQVARPWRCLRHNGRTAILSPENPHIHTETPMTVKEYGQFWASHGFVYGIGFNAWADDFPPGTSLVIDVTAIPPTVN